MWRHLFVICRPPPPPPPFRHSLVLVRNDCFQGPVLILLLDDSPGRVDAQSLLKEFSLMGREKELPSIWLFKTASPQTLSQKAEWLLPQGKQTQDF